MNEEELFEREFENGIKTKTQLEFFYKQGFRNSSVAYLRFILMAFVCIWNFSVPDPAGFLTAVAGFAIPCFYILSGYYILTDDPKTSTVKAKRKIRRSFACFAFMFAFYLLLNLIGCGITQIKDSLSFQSIFNFLVLNIWPLTIGRNIWFIHAMLYAYIVIYFAEKLKLMRFYKVFLILSLIFLLLSGELAGLEHINALALHSLPENWFTRALPYILLGKLLREKEELLLRIAAWKYIVISIAGAGLSVGEIFLLNKMNLLVNDEHLIAYIITATAVCGLALSKPLGSDRPVTAFLTHYDPVLSGIIYILMVPLYYIIGVLIMYFCGIGYYKMISYFGGMAAYALSLVLALLFRNFKPFKSFYS